MNCFVTGGTGLVGSNLVGTLLEHGHNVVITGHEAEQRLPNFSGKILHPSFIGLDWEEIGKIDVLFHQAAMNDTRFLDRKEMIRINVESSISLFEQVIHRGCRRIVYASSTAVYGRNPAPYTEKDPFDLNTPYAESKRLLEERILVLGKRYSQVTFVGLRYSNIYGPGENHKGKRASMIYQLAQQMVKGNPRLFRYGEQKRDYIYVRDVVKANLLGAYAGESCIVNCGSGQATSFNQIVEILNDVLDVRRTPVYMANPWEGNYQEHTQCDMSLAKERLHFTPTYDIQSGIREYYSKGALVS